MTDSDHAFKIAPDLLAAGLPGGDVTYVRTREGWDDLAVIIDPFSRRVIGWTIRNSMTQDPAIRALNMPVALRRPQPGCVQPTDDGRQGGFNRSSRHLDSGGADADRKAQISAVHAEEVALAGAARAIVLGDLPSLRAMAQMPLPTPNRMRTVRQNGRGQQIGHESGFAKTGCPA